MKFKKILLAALIFSAVALFTLAGCAPTEIVSGRYCAESNNESYIEVYDDRTMLFVNVDFSAIENDESFINVAGEINIAEKFDGKPQSYSELFYDQEEDIYFCYITVTESMSFFVKWSERDNSLIFNYIVYKLQ